MAPPPPLLPPPKGLLSPSGQQALQAGAIVCGTHPHPQLPPPSPCRASSDSFIQMQKAFQSSQSL